MNIEIYGMMTKVIQVDHLNSDLVTALPGGVHMNSLWMWWISYTYQYVRWNNTAYIAVVPVLCSYGRTARTHIVLERRWCRCRTLACPTLLCSCRWRHINSRRSGATQVFQYNCLREACCGLLPFHLFNELNQLTPASLWDDNVSPPQCLITLVTFPKLGCLLIWQGFQHFAI